MWTGGLPHLPGVPHLHVNRPIGWTATTRGSLSNTLNSKPAQLAERVWCTKVLSSLLNIYFRLISYQARSFLFISAAGRTGVHTAPKYGSNPIRYVTPHFRDWRGTASLLRLRNRAATTVFVGEQKPYPVSFSWRRKSYLVLYEHSIKVPIDVVDVNYQNCWGTESSPAVLPSRNLSRSALPTVLETGTGLKEQFVQSKKKQRVVTHNTFFGLNCPYLLIPYRIFTSFF